MIAAALQVELHSHSVMAAALEVELQNHSVMAAALEVELQKHSVMAAALEIELQKFLLQEHSGMWHLIWLLCVLVAVLPLFVWLVPSLVVSPLRSASATSDVGWEISQVLLPACVVLD